MADAWSRVPVDIDGGAAAARASAMAKGSVAAGATAAARLPLPSAEKAVEAMAGWGKIHADAPVLAGGIKEEAFARSIVPCHWH